MRMVTAIVLACCLAMSSATLKLFKSRSRSGLKIQPMEGYSAVKYLRTPVEVSLPLPVSTFRTHVTTYAVSPPSLLPPIPTYVARQACSVPVYPQTLAIGYSAPSVIGYSGPHAAYIEPPYSAQVIEEQYSACDESGGAFGWK